MFSLNFNLIDFFFDILQELNALFRNTLNEKTIKLRKLSQKLGKCVSESRPYHECRSRVTELQQKCQMAVQSFERSAELHSQSKETITIAEHKFAEKKSNDSDFDPFWQEILNQANTKVFYYPYLYPSSTPPLLQNNSFVNPID